MTSSDSSSSVRVVSPPGSGETSRCDPEVGSSGVSSRPPSLVDARVLRDLEVMKLDHDLDTAVIEGSLAVIRERYSIPVEYGLHVPQPGQRPYSLDAPDMCISVDALEAGLRFPLHPLIEVVEGLSQPGSAQLVALPCHLLGRVSSRLGTCSWRAFTFVRVGVVTTSPPGLVFESAGHHLPITKVGSPATFMIVVQFGGLGSTGWHTRSATPPRTYPRKPSWSTD
ncbi:hypothetical protein B296_00017985 [Ensete ventricosum]|uniref:Uncharacterized protein n=1 Tax=Ensete ventricosum TaxID=4639 RepID=A0A426X4C2_ENSVE|nr:hypothetical protein B296_00017985 [Ensete ventricosum]